jgi:hypothetical protein
MNANDYRGSAGLAGCLCVPRAHRKEVARSPVRTWDVCRTLRAFAAHHCACFLGAAVEHRGPGGTCRSGVRPASSITNAWAKCAPTAGVGRKSPLRSNPQHHHPPRLPQTAAIAPILTPVIIDVRGGRADQIASGSDGLVDMFRATECRRLVYIYTLRQP